MTDIVERLNSPEIAFSVNNSDALLNIREAADTIEALRAENARLREALKPFSDMAKYYDANGIPTTRLIANVQIRLLRAARTAMGETGET